MSNKKAMMFALASIAALSLSAVTLVSPKEGKTMCLLNDGNKAFLSMDAAARRKIFTDKDWRREAATKWRSVPKPVTLKWTDAKNEKVHVTVTKKGADSPWFDEDVTGESVEVWNLEIAREYEWTVSDGGEVARGTFKTHDFAPRVMKIKGVPNFRDLGGWKTLDGGRVRQGLVYRSQGLNNNALYYLTSAETMALYKAGKLEELYGKDGKEIKERIDREGGKDDFDPNAPWMRKSLPRADPQPPKARLDGPTKAYLLDKLGIKSDIDLRGPTEVWGMTESPLGPRATWFWLQNHAYGGMHQPNGKEGFTKVFKVFLDEKNYPIDFHCIGGADRTGCDAWILNGLLGVAEDDLMKDWELTCFEYGSQAFGHHRIAHFLKGLEEYPGSTMKEKCESYVKALGFTDDDIAKFRSIMLESAADQLAANAGEVEAREDALSAGRVIIPGNSLIKISADRKDALYRCGDETAFSVVVNETDGVKAASGIVSWQLDNYGAKVLAKGTVDLSKSNPFTVKGTMNVPGFLRIVVKKQGDKSHKTYSTAYEPEKIRTAIPKPADFDSFWDNAIAKLEREVPLDPQVEPVPGYPKNGCMAERVSFATANGKRVHALLVYPQKPGRYPVRLGFPGAGPGPSLSSGKPDSKRISFTMNSHYYRIGDNKAETDALYAAEEGEWRKVHGHNKARAYPVGGMTLSREEAHYYGIILGCNRAINWLMATHKDRIDPEHVTYSGASQGGGFGLILTALNKNIRRAYAGVPALTDVMGCKADGRQSGWPRILEYETQTDPARLAKIEANAPYFDAAYFAERITVPIRLSVGYIDESCAPHAVCAAFNAIPSKDKKLYHGIGGSHSSPNAPRGEIAAWLDK